MRKNNRNKVNKKRNTRNSKRPNNRQNIEKIRNSSNRKPVRKSRGNKKTFKKVSIKAQNNRMVFIMILFILMLITVFVRMGYLQLVKGKELAEEALDHQMIEKTISANRGNILDRNGEILAQSLSVDTISINPHILRDNTEDLDKEDFAENIAKIFGLKKEDILKKVDSESSYEPIIEKQEKAKVDELRKYIRKHDIVGVNIDPDFKRSYPYGKLASNVIGFCGTDNSGLEGLELELNDILIGKKGRVRTMPSLYNTFKGEDINAEDGSNVYLTLDVKIQSILEKHLEEAHRYNDNDSSIAIAMNPQTSEILAMATAPTYDLNQPFKPIGIAEADWNKYSFERKQNIQQNMWKNTAITDGYEPGSVYKMVTAAIGLEENNTSTDKAGDFLCTGSHKVVDTSINCWSWYNPHGKLTLRDSIAKSCNPAFMQLAERVGKDTYYKYMEAFGLFDKTGVRLSGEQEGIKHELENVGPVELAVMSFGQRFTITPLQMLNAASTIANGGILYEPQIIKQINNPKTGGTEVLEPKVIRKVLSQQTSDEMMDMLHTGCGIHARIPGYKIAGKSGTSEPQPGREAIDGYVASFCAVAPADDPQIALIVVQKHPKGYGYVDGGSISGKVVNQMLREILPLIGVTKEGEKQNIIQKDLATIPNVKDKSLSQARKELQERGFNVVVKTVLNPNETKVIEQVPDPNIKLEKGSKIYLYVDKKDKKTTVSVPDVLNKNINNATSILNKSNLNYIIEGKSGSVVKQEPEKGSIIEEGSIVKIQIK